MLLRYQVTIGAIRGLAVAGALFLSRAVEAVAYNFDFNPLAIALLATLVFAVPLNSMFIANTSSELRSVTLAAEFATLGVGALSGFLALSALPSVSRELYCFHDIPWRTSIAGFGGFALAMLELMIDRRRLTSLLGPLPYLGFFWIAPWYGFFQPAAFVALVTAYPCAERTLPTTATAFAAMILGRLIGARLAAWLVVR